MIKLGKEEAINKEIPVPRYYQLAEFIREKIQLKRIAPGDPLWSERKLMDKFKISLATVRKAYEVLEEEGLVVKVHGRGTFVADTESKTVTVKVLFDSRIIPEKTFGQMTDIFKEKNPHIEIDSIFVKGNNTWHDHIERFNPDIYCLDESSWRILHDQDLLLNMQDLAAQDEDILSGIYDKVIDCFRTESGLFGVPYRFSTYALIYNKELFDSQKLAYPEETTWKTFLDIAKKMTVSRINGSIKHYGFISSSSINNLSTFVRQNNGSICPFEEEKGFGSEAVKEAVKFWYSDMVHEYKVSPESGIVDAYDLFVKGKVAMFCERYYSASLLDKNSDFEWGVAPLPRGKKRACTLPVQAFSIARNTKSVASAWNFIKFMADPQVQADFDQEGWGLPAQRAAAEKLPFSKVFIDELEYAEPAWPYAFNEPRQIIKEEISMLKLMLQNADVTCNKIARRCRKVAEKKKSAL
ncbi:MAG: extracellular solute-binding protein [Planctomycetota bacterium]|jgi:multiple sugar transport system substrate-binding protein